MGRGIHQGCPLSGQLYTLTIELFLSLLRKKLQGVCTPELGLVRPVCLSAYADDLTILSGTSRTLKQQRKVLVSISGPPLPG